MIDDESSADLRTGEASAFRRVGGDRLFQSLLARLGLCDGEAMRRTRRIGLRIVRTGAGADVAARIGPVDMAVIETYGRRVAVVMVRHECHRLHQHAEQQYGLREPVVSQVPHLPQKYAFFPNMEIPGVFLHGRVLRSAVLSVRPQPSEAGYFLFSWPVRECGSGNGSGGRDWEVSRSYAERRWRGVESGL